MNEQVLNNSQNEIWVPVKGYEGLYEVSAWGRVRTLSYRGTGKTRLLRQCVGAKGYLTVVLDKNGKSRSHPVHRLVAHAFIPNPLGLPRVDHKNENKTHNCVGNLEWCGHASELTPEKYPILQDLYVNQLYSVEQLAHYFHCRTTTITQTLRTLGVFRKGVRKNRRLREDYFDVIDTPIKAYFLGLLLTDGSVVAPRQGRQASIGLELVATDRAILELLRAELGIDGAICSCQRQGHNPTCCLKWRGDRMAESLAKWNIIPNKTYGVNTAVIPDTYPIDFLRGFVDGDGSIYFSQNSWHFNICGHSRALIAQIAAAISALDGQDVNAIQVSDNVYRHTWNGQEAIRLLKILYSQDSTCAIARKMAKARQACEDKSTQDIV